MQLAYVAGKLNDDACGYIQNLHRMVRRSIKIKKLGYFVYVPGIDIVMGLLAGDYEYADYFDNSQAILRRCDLVIVTEGWETSKGTCKEIDLALALGIPVYFYIESLDKIVPWNMVSKHRRIDIE